MFKHRWMIALLVSLLAVPSAWTAENPGDWNQPGKKWSRGPVRCLITPDEQKELKGLKTDEEIAKFVKEFWARRDPTPDTPANEFLDFFTKRVEEADKKFIQTTDSGAISDRGQVFLLLGPPTRIEPHRDGAQQEWIYENVPNMTPSSFSVLFGAVGAGIFKLLGRKEVDQIVDANEFLRGLGEKAKQVFAPAPTVAAALPSASESAPPPEVATEESKILDSVAGSELLPSAIPVQIHTDLYEATKGDSFAAVTLGVPRTDAGAGTLVGFARFLPDAPDVKPVTLAAADSFSPADPENSDPASPVLVYQGGVGLHPGHYTLLAGVRDPASGKVGVVRQPLEVPKYEGNLVLSTVTLARKLEKSAPPAAAEGKKPAFFLGTFRVIPSLDGVFKQGSDLAWYYQIYNATPDPATGQLNLTIEYNFLLKQKGEYRPVTSAQVERNRSSQIGAFSFQLVKPTASQKGWVEGDYKVTIKVTDEVTKSSTSAELPFKIVP